MSSATLIATATEAIIENSMIKELMPLSEKQQPIYQLSVSVCLTSTVQVTPAKISEPSCNGESG